MVVDAGMDGGSGAVVTHLDVIQQTLRMDAGSCAPFLIQAMDSAHQPAPYYGPQLTFQLLPQSSSVTVYGGSSCSGPAIYAQGPGPQSGSLKSEVFGTRDVYPTAVSSAGSFTQGEPLAVTSVAYVSGFPGQLPWNGCTLVTLTTSHKALEDTVLTLNELAGTFVFDASGCNTRSGPPQINTGTNVTTAMVRTGTGGIVRVEALSADVLESSFITVSLVRPDGGSCVGTGNFCSASAQCCSNSCPGAGSSNGLCD
jgi:hypothetical protein